MKVRSLVMMALAATLATFQVQRTEAALPAACAAETARARTDVKWYPGYYVSAIQASTATESLKRINNTLLDTRNSKEVRGTLVRFFWSQLHPRDGGFDFARVDDAIKAAESHGEKIVLFVSWKYNPPGLDSPVPSFIKSLTAQKVHYDIAGMPGDTGRVAALDNPVVAAKFVEFLKALRNFVDTRPAVAAITFAESAPSIDWSRLSVTSTQRNTIQNTFFANFLWMTKQAGCLFRKTPVIVSAHFPSNLLSQWTQAFKDYGVGYGGADVWLNDPEVEGPLKAYSYYPAVEADIPIAATVASANFIYPSGAAQSAGKPRLSTGAYETTQLLGRKAVTQLKANFVFWKNSADQYYDAFQRHAATLDQAYPTIPRTDKVCPRQYPSCVTN